MAITSGRTTTSVLPATSGRTPPHILTPVSRPASQASLSCPFGLEELLANLGLAFEHEVVVPGPVAIKLRPQFGIGDLKIAHSLLALEPVSRGVEGLEPALLPKHAAAAELVVEVPLELPAHEHERRREALRRLHRLARFLPLFEFRAPLGGQLRIAKRHFHGVLITTGR